MCVRDSNFQGDDGKAYKAEPEGEEDKASRVVSQFESQSE
jgi:hypothetical protein